MKTCETVREAVSAWLDGELEPEYEAGMLAHTSECEECRSFLETCRVMSEDLRMDIPPLPETLIPGVMRRVAEERQTAVPDAGSAARDDRSRVYRRVAVWACAAACLALVILAGPWNWRVGSSGTKADKAEVAPTTAESFADGGAAPAEAAGSNEWSREEQKSAAYEMYDAAEADAAYAVTEEATDDMAFPADEPADDCEPQAQGAEQLLGDYAAVISVYGEIPESVLALSEGEEVLSDGVAWLIPAEKADDLLDALEDAEAYEWLSGTESEERSWLLVRMAEN